MALDGRIAAFQRCNQRASVFPAVKLSCIPGKGSGPSGRIHSNVFWPALLSQFVALFLTVCGSAHLRAPVRASEGNCAGRAEVDFSEFAPNAWIDGKLF